MENFYITKDVQKLLKGKPINLMEEVRKKLMTPDVILAMKAGCRFEVTLDQNDESVTISLKSKEKVSILKLADGTPIDIIIKR